MVDLNVLLAKYDTHISKLRETVPSAQDFKYIVKQKYATEVYKGDCKNTMKQVNVGKNTSP